MVGQHHRHVGRRRVVCRFLPALRGHDGAIPCTVAVAHSGVPAVTNNRAIVPPTAKCAAQSGTFFLLTGLCRIACRDAQRHHEHQRPTPAAGCVHVHLAL